MLVPVLAALARPGEPCDLQVAIAERGRLGSLSRLHDCDGDGAGVDAAPLFSRRDALDAMSASFGLKALASLALDLYIDLHEAGTARPLKRPAGLSTLAKAKLLVSAGEVANEQLGVFAALGRTNFDDAFHGGHLLKQRPIQRKLARTFIVGLDICNRIIRQQSQNQPK